MAETLAVAASVIAVLQITNSVISICYDYSAAATGAPWELPRLTSELESLRSVLQRLEPLAKQADFSSAIPNAKMPAFTELCKPNGPLALCRREIEGLEAALKTPDWSAGFGPKRKALVQALRWPLKSKDAEKALKQISRLREILSFALTADQTALSLEIQRLSESINATVLDSQQSLRSIREVTLNMQDHVSSSHDLTLDVSEHVKSMKSAGRKKEILDWLSAPDPSTNYQNACRSRHAGTGSWFLGGKGFSRWKMDPNSLLWLHGNAGCGKTVLSSTVITEILQLCSHSSGSSLAYFFFDFNDSGKQKCSQMVRSIIEQLCCQSNDAMIEVESLFSSCQNGQKPADLATLMITLQAAIRKSKNTYIILDALDECSDIVDLLAVIQEIVEGSIPALHLLCTSRWLSTVEETVQNLTTSDRIIQIQSKIVDTDISNYISHRLQTDPKLRRWRKRPDIQEEIRAALTEKVDGMFRWAVCQLISIQACPNLPTLREALRSLPKTLDETYSRTLCNIPNEYSDYAVSVLRWLAYVEKPMRLTQLGELIAVNLSGNPWLDADIRFPDPRDLLDIFSGLLQVEANESENPIVRLAHFSVKEYLISERIKTQKTQKFWLPKIQSHEFIAATCLAYILHVDGESHLFKDFNSCSLKALEEYPLASYICWHWTTHAGIVDSHSGVLKDLSLEFLHRSDLRKVWFREFYAGPLLHTREEEPEYIPPLFIAASIGVLGIVQNLLDLGHDVNEQCDLGTALQSAAAQGHYIVLRHLLDNGADPNLLGRENCSPLQAAARFGTVESVKALIDYGADIHNQCGSYGSSLIAACISSHPGSSGEKSAEFLLDKGANIHILSKEHGNALHAACAQPRANIALIKELVSKGMEIDKRGGKYGTALQAACAHSRNDPVISFLLSQADPCVEVKDSKYGTALQAICAESHDNDKAVKLLLDRGARKTVRGGKYGTVLHAACRRGNEKIVRLLLRDQCPEKAIVGDQNLDINEVAAKYGTPLHAACLGRNEKIARLLVELGANINVNVPQLGTPLHIVCRRQKSMRIAKLLLANGADVNIRRNRRPYTALEILQQDRENPKIQKIFCVVEDGFSRSDLIGIRELKRAHRAAEGTDFSSSEISES